MASAVTFLIQSGSLRVKAPFATVIQHEDYIEDTDHVLRIRMREGDWEFVLRVSQTDYDRTSGLIDFLIPISSLVGAVAAIPERRMVVNNVDIGYRQDAMRYTLTFSTEFGNQSVFVDQETFDGICGA